MMPGRRSRSRVVRAPRDLIRTMVVEIALIALGMPLMTSAVTSGGF
jgi:hypothetical protein